MEPNFIEDDAVSPLPAMPMRESLASLCGLKNPATLAQCLEVLRNRREASVSTLKQSPGQVLGAKDISAAQGVRSTR
jgi:hypothetical protein